MNDGEKQSNYDDNRLKVVFRKYGRFAPSNCCSAHLIPDEYFYRDSNEVDDGRGLYILTKFPILTEWLGWKWEREEEIDKSKKWALLWQNMPKAMFNVILSYDTCLPANLH